MKMEGIRSRYRENRKEYERKKSENILELMKQNINVQPRVSKQRLTRSHLSEPNLVRQRRSTSTVYESSRLLTRPRTASSRKISHSKSNSYNNAKRPSSAIPSLIDPNSVQDLEERRQIDVGFMVRGDGELKKQLSSLDHIAHKHNFAIEPDQVVFGNVVRGNKSDVRTITLQNMSTLSGRFRVLPFENRCFRAKYGNTVVAPGMTQKITLQVDASNLDLGLIQEELVIMVGSFTKYHILLSAQIISDPVMKDDGEDPCDLSMFDLIPRLPNTVYNWKKEEIIVQADTQPMFDSKLTLQQVLQNYGEKRARIEAQPLEPYCTRVYDQIRPHDPDIDSSESSFGGGKQPIYEARCMSPTIYSFLSS